MWNCFWTCSLALSTFGRFFGHASMKRKNTEQIVDCILRVIKPDNIAAERSITAAPLRPSQPLVLRDVHSSSCVTRSAQG